MVPHAASVFAQPITWNYLGGIPPSPTMLGETTDGILYAVSGSRIYTSSDAGVDWIQPTPVVGSIEEFHINGNRLLVSRFVGGPYSHQLFTSTNDGSSWARVFYEAVPLNMEVFGEFLLTDSGTIYGFHNVTSISGMLYRLQSGSFVPIGAQVPLNGATVSGIEISLIDHNNTIYAGTRAGGLYISPDMGTTWTQVLMYAVSAIAVWCKEHCCRRCRQHAECFRRGIRDLRPRCHMEKSRNAGKSIYFHRFGQCREYSRFHNAGKLLF